MPKVSIITPAYNCGMYISETLDSVINQTYSDWECIIIDDGSFDTTKEVVMGYCQRDPRFHYYYQTNQGPSAARNQAIQHSTGDFILPLDSDDLISATYIEKAAEYLMFHPEITLVYAKGDFFGEENGVWELPTFKYDNFIWNNCICSCAMYRRCDYNKTSGYNTNMIYGDEDWDFWLSLLNNKSKVYCIDEVLFHYRIRKESRSAISLSPNNNKSKRLIYFNHMDIFQPYIQDIVLIHDQKNKLLCQLADVQKELDHIHHSYAYRIGKCLLKPFLLFRALTRHLFSSQMTLA